MQELLPFGRFLFLFPVVLLGERFLGCFFVAFRHKSAVTLAMYGFFIYATMASVFLRYIYENPYVIGNVKDILLIGMIVGIPTGLLMHSAGIFARKNFSI